MERLEYRFGPHSLDASQVVGFFVGWPAPPSSETLVALLAKSDEAVVAMDVNRVVGYVTGLTDGVLFPSITSLEVLPEFQGHGVGKELMRRMIERLGNVYATDLVCDEDVVPFYEKVGMRRAEGMVVRRYDLQGGSR